MKTAVEKLEGNKVLLKVEVSVEKFDEAIHGAYKEVGNKVKIPGFRKGKIPQEIIKTRVGENVVVEEALDRNLINYYAEAVNHADIQPIDKPDFNVIQSEAGKPLLFEVKVDVRPEVKLGEYKNLDIKIDPIEVSDEEVDKEVENLRDKFSKLEISPDDTKLKEGDFALIDFKGHLNDEPFEGGSASDYLLEIGSKNFVPGFEDQLIGASKGEERQISITFPEDYDAAELAGKETKFDVQVKEIKYKVLPEINDDFAKEVGGFDALEELRKDIKEKIKDMKTKNAEHELHGKILEAVYNGSEVEIPEIMITKHSNDVINNFANSLSAQGMNMEAYLNQINKDFKAFVDDVNKNSERDIKVKTILEAIGRAEGFIPTEDEINEEINFYASKNKQNFEDLKNFIITHGDLPILKSDIIVNKTLHWLIENEKEKLGWKTESENIEEPDTSEGLDMSAIFEGIDQIKGKEEEE
ncbi:MAG: trigger factor [Actinobacteria bacterium]|nr:trigger factor [Actinomycetota bacterium]